MFIDVAHKKGYFFAKPAFSKEKHFIYDFAANKKIFFPAKEEHEFLAFSPDGTRMALGKKCVARGTNKTELLVYAEGQDTPIYTTKNYFVFDAVFDAHGEKLLLAVHNAKPQCISLATGQVFSEVKANDARLYTGSLHLLTNTFYTPSKKKGVLLAISFNDGSIKEIKLPVKALLARAVLSYDQKSLYISAENDHLLTFHDDFSLIWEKDFSSYAAFPGAVGAAGIFMSEDGLRLVLSVSATPTNDWGAEFVLDSKNGEIVRVIEGKKGGPGRLASNFFNRGVFTYLGHVLNIDTGEFTPKPVV